MGLAEPARSDTPEALYNAERALLDGFRVIPLFHLPRVFGAGPRVKGGPGITRSDLLVINKIDLAPFVGASLEVMERDARKMRGERPFLFTNLKAEIGVAEIAQHIVAKGGL